jgi:hypothetical protein
MSAGVLSESSDPVKVAQVVLRLAASDRLPAHLLPGSGAQYPLTSRSDTRSRCRTLARFASRPTSTLRHLASFEILAAKPFIRWSMLLARLRPL